ncbi:MAG: MCE family protein [Carbonactinosporaceae bacterium]
MRRRLTWPLRVLAPVIAAATLVTGCEFEGLYGLPLPGGAATGDDVYRVTVEFDNVVDLVPQSQVRVNDVTVGMVEDIWLQGWTAKVRLRVEDSVKLPDNAVARLQQTSLLGEKFVALSGPGQERPYGQLSDGDLIPLSSTTRYPEVEEVLSALSLLLNGGGIAQLKTITVELNRALKGNEEEVNQLLEDLEEFVGELDEHKSEIVRAIAGIDRLTRTLNAERDTIANAIDTLGPGLKVLADQRKQFTRMLVELSELGKVSARVIEQSKAATLADLRALAPILTNLSQAGEDLPKALELLITYPFPKNFPQAVHGDFTNLRVTADLNLAVLFGNLTGSPLPGAGQGAGGGPGGDDTRCPPELLPGVQIPRDCPTPTPDSGGAETPGVDKPDVGGDAPEVPSKPTPDAPKKDDCFLFCSSAPRGSGWDGRVFALHGFGRAEEVAA